MKCSVHVVAFQLLLASPFLQAGVQSQQAAVPVADPLPGPLNVEVHAEPILGKGRSFA